MFRVQTGDVVVALQALLFALCFIFAPKHGVIAAHLRAREVQS
ncbi:hypothetical protein [uncultured Bartonella sp.]|nr:hypothetical protein [uncultured Bartonella sp.]